MTVSTLINRAAYTATAAQTDFSYPFRIFTGEESTLLVYLNTVLQALTTDYTVTGAGVGAGGNVAFNSGLTAGDKVVIVRSLALSQLVDYVANDPFPAETHEEALDRLTMLVQQLEEANNRAITLIVTSALSDITFPDPGGGEYIKWNSGGTALETGTFTGSGTEVSSFMATVLDDLTAAAARTTLGAGTSSYSDPLTTRGDSLVRDSANATARLPVGAANTFLGSDGTDVAHRAIATADLPAGTVLQTISVTKTDTFTTANTTYIDVTGLSKSITLADNTNKVLVTVMLAFANTAGGAGSFAQLVRGSTAIAIGDAASTRIQASVGSLTLNTGVQQACVSWLDSPATAGAVTYKIQVRAGNTPSTVINSQGLDTDSTDYGRYVSSIVLQEIQA